MATSGTRTLTRTRDDIIIGALRLLGLYKPGGTAPHREIFDFAADSLNDMITEWQADGVGQWLKANATLYMQYGTSEYNIGPSGDHCTLSAIETTLSADGSAGESTITVDSITGISDNDYIGIELDNNYFQFTTVNGTPSGSTITLDDVLTDNVNDGDFVFAYTNKVSRPLDIEDVRYVQDDDTEIQINSVSRNEYMAISDKSDTGTPNIVHYQPTMTNGKLYVWQPPDDVELRLRFTIMQPIEVFTSRTDNPCFPQEWFNTLKYNLADYMGLEYMTQIDNFGRLDARRYLLIQEKAREYRDKMFGNDTARSPVQFVAAFWD